MENKTIVAFADGSDAGLFRVQTALDLARRSGAHVEAAYFYKAPPLPIGADLTMVDNGYEALLTQEAARAQAIVDRLEALGARGGSLSAYAQSSREGQFGQLAALAMHGADLAIAALPEDDAGQAEILEGALFASGAACLALPRWISPHPWGERVLVAWKATSQAGRALAAALPFLARARAVRLLVVNPRGGQVGEDSAGVDRLAARMARHGVQIEAPVLMNADANKTARAIADEAEGFGADLLVLGAYGHSRLTEWALGGVTRHMIRNAKIPLLMAH